MELVDCHSHSQLSGHGTGTVEDMVRQAAKLGLSTYCQTEHLTLPSELDPLNQDSIPEDQMSLYLQSLAFLAFELAEQKSPLQLICGIEADWLEGRAEDLCRMCAPFDYVIGSIHFLEGLALDNPDDMALWETYGTDGVWERYLNALEHLVRSGAPIDTLGHVDLPKLFGDLPSFSLRDAFGDLAQVIAAKGLMIEVNTAGLHKKMGECYPSHQVLEVFAQAGVECTVGADAHKPAHVARDIPKAYVLMHQAGYKYLSVPEASHGRRQLPL